MKQRACSTSTMTDSAQPSGVYHRATTSNKQQQILWLGIQKLQQIIRGTFQFMNINNCSNQEECFNRWHRLIDFQYKMNHFVVLVDYVLMVLYAFYNASFLQFIFTIVCAGIGFMLNMKFVTLRVSLPGRDDSDEQEVRKFSWLPQYSFTVGFLERARLLANMAVFVIRFYFLKTHKGLLIPLLTVFIGGIPKTRNAHWPLLPSSFVFANYLAYTLWETMQRVVENRSIRAGLEVIFEYYPYLAVILVMTLYMVSVSFYLTLECEKLLKASQQLKESLKMKDIFVSHISHEFRSPVFSSMGSIELLKETELTDKQKEHVETIQSANGIVLALIEDILNYIRLEQEKIDGRIENNETRHRDEIFSLQSVVNMVDAIIKNYAQQLHVTVQITSDIENIIVKGDQTGLYQCLTNLLTNAVKASKHHDVVELKCNLLSEDSQNNRLWVEFQVTDHGIGIDESKQALIFQPFVQLQGYNESIYPGTGLGLATVKNNLKLMKGTVQCKSKLGEGSTFTLTIPFDKVEQQDLSARALTEHCTTQVQFQKQYMEKYIKARKEHEVQSVVDVKTDLAASHPSIILAEDNAINRMVILKLLKSLGYEAEAVCDGRELVQKVNPQYHRLIITDFNMPNMDGLEAAQELRKMHGSSIKILLLTADGLKEQKNVGGVIDSVLHKPCSKQELKSHMEQLLS